VLAARAAAGSSRRAAGSARGGHREVASRPGNFWVFVVIPAAASLQAVIVFGFALIGLNLVHEGVARLFDVELLPFDPEELLLPYVLWTVWGVGFVWCLWKEYRKRRTS
jgi:hypothetical protein